MRKPFILGLDGIKSAPAILDIIAKTLKDPKEIVDFISYFKFNDALHLEGMKGENGVLAKTVRLYPKINIFWDVKSADTNGTDKNVLAHYLPFMRLGDIVTMSSTSSVAALKEVRGLIPSGVKIAIASVLTDTTIDECQMRRGMSPEMAILNDVTNLLRFSDNLFDAVVCSPAEIKFLKLTLPDNIETIVPAIRDYWMKAGQQAEDRMGGIEHVLNAGADFMVLGAQLMKGHPEQGIDPVKSRDLSIAKAMKSKELFIIKNDPLATLINFKGYYQSPMDDKGKFLGPLVAYNGTYVDEAGVNKNYVGPLYFNMAVVEDDQRILNYFAKIMAKKILAFEEQSGYVIDCLVGVPEGGSKIAQEVGRLLGIPGIRLEKKVLAVETKTTKEVFDFVMRRNAEVIQLGSHVILFEDLINNLTGTGKAVKALQDVGAISVGVACMANRSKDYIDKWNNLPIIAGLSVPSDQYRQDDPLVCDLVNSGNFSINPRRDWKVLKAAMEEAK